MIKERIIDAGTASVVAALVVLAWLLASYERDQFGASAPQPGPTVTATAPPTTKTVGPSSTTRVNSSTRATEHRSNTELVAAAGPAGPRSVKPSGPVPHPTTPTAPRAATSSCDVGLSVLALKACLSLGK